MQPINSRVLVRPIKKADGTIIIPESYQPNPEEPIEAEVVILGRENRDAKHRPIPWTVKPGDRVLLVDFMGAEVQAFGQRHLVVKEENILAVIECAQCGGKGYTHSPSMGVVSCLACNMGVRNAEKRHGKERSFLP